MPGTFHEYTINNKQRKEQILIRQEIENRDKNLDKIQSIPKPYDVADLVISNVQGHFKVGQSLSNPINISFSKPQPILNEQSDSSSDGYYYYAYILKNNYKYQISITIGHYPLKKKMAKEWDISYAVRRCKHKLSLSDRLAGVKSHHSEYVKGDYLKTINASSTNQDDLITEISVSSIYLLEELIEKYINGNSRQRNPVRITRKKVHTRILEKLASVFRHRLSFIHSKSY